MKKTEDKSRVINKISDTTIGGKYVGGDDNSVTNYYFCGENISSDKTVENKELTIDSKKAFSAAVAKYKKYYIDKWNDRLFLHRGENDKPLTLKNTFIHHDYSEIKQSTGSVISENNADIEKYIESFIDNKRCDSILVTGVPGVGKSSFTAYMANKYADDNSVVILRFKDFKENELKGDSNQKDYSGIHFAICKNLGISVDVFDEYIAGKTLILDGFDELRDYSFKQNILKDFIKIADYNKNFGIIITSRENYIDLREIEFNQYLRLEPFSEDIIRQYYKDIKCEELSKEITIENQKVLGIPVILYMALSVDIDITTNGSRCELYEKIFALDGGIFDRFKLPDSDAWEEGAHPTKSYKKSLHKLLQRLAFNMFKYNTDTISKNDYINLVKEIKDSNNQPVFECDLTIILDFPIKNLYEGTDNIEFVHQSIYEYFIACYIYQTIEASIKTGEKEKLAETFAHLFHANIMDREIIEYLYYMLSGKVTPKMEEFVLETFRLMLNKGMTFYSADDDRKNYNNTLECELNILKNMLEVIHIYKVSTTIINLNEDKEKLAFYINNLDNFDADLSEIDISDVIIRGANLSGADMRGANLSGADMRSVDMRGADMSGANLKDAIMIRADMSLAYMKGANMFRADMRGADMSGADMSGANMICTSMNDADMNDANLNDANMFRADMRSANLREANLEGANLREANLKEVDLSNADLKDTNLSGANINGVILDTKNIKLIKDKFPELF